MITSKATVVGVYVLATGWITLLDVGTPWVNVAARFAVLLATFMAVNHVLGARSTAQVLEAAAWGSIIVAIPALLAGWVEGFKRQVGIPAYAAGMTALTAVAAAAYWATRGQV